VVAQPAPDLRLDGLVTLGGLVLEAVEAAQVTLGLDQLDHGFGTKCADQFVLEVADAHEKADGLQVGDAVGGGSQTGRRQGRAELTRFRLIA
jgi:hypothetical protein